MEDKEVVRFSITREANEVFVVLGLKAPVIQLDEFNELVHKCKNLFGATLFPEGSRRRCLCLYVVVNRSKLDLIKDLSKHQGELVTYLDRAYLKSDKGNEAVEQAYYVQEATRDVLSYDDSRVVILRIALTLDVPVLNGADDVRLVGPTELNLNLIALTRGWISKQQIETPELPILP